VPAHPEQEESLQALLHIGDLYVASLVQSIPELRDVVTTIVELVSRNGYPPLEVAGPGAIVDVGEPDPLPGEGLEALFCSRCAIAQFVVDAWCCSFGEEHWR
jgi:hypothetical protein